MKNYLTKADEIYYDEKNFKEEENKANGYKVKIDNAIKDIIDSGKRLVFASVAKKAEVTQITVYKYPELRTYILKEIEIQKQLQVINERIEKAVIRLKKSKKKITFVALMNSCNFDYDDLTRNSYIRDRVRVVVIENVKCKAKGKTSIKK